MPLVAQANKSCHGRVLNPANSRILSRARADNAITIDAKKMTAIDLLETSRVCDSVLVFAGRIRFAHHDSTMMGPTTSTEIALGAISMMAVGVGLYGRMEPEDCVVFCRSISFGYITKRIQSGRCCVIPPVSLGFLYQGVICHFVDLPKNIFCLHTWSRTILSNMLAASTRPLLTQSNQSRWGFDVS